VNRISWLLMTSCFWMRDASMQESAMLVFCCAGSPGEEQADSEMRISAAIEIWGRFMFSSCGAR
jgi:hypothetical protein